ncbi:MAG TPA: Hsp70 family protein, partial [Planctomycetia bacterium]|nr:Hsp70 family protein [Planctomycetia bacterium]
MAQPLPIVRSPQHQSAAPILGIDLGTTFSLAAWLAPDGPRMVRDDSGDARVPSAIVFGKDGRVTVGWEARAHLLEDPEHAAYSVKRLVGKSLAELEGDLAYVPFQVIERQAEGGRRSLHVRIADREYTSEELSAIILRDVVARANRALGKKVERAVITVPAYFDEAQRQATRDAGRIAGLDVVRIINEPTAAALAYGLHRRDTARIAVYDLGGGTFDCSILQLREGAFKVLSTHGDTRLGGDDFDAALMDVFKDEFIAFAGDYTPIARQALRDGCERLKHALSVADSAELIVVLPESGRRFAKPCSRAEFEALIEPLVERTLQSCRRALKDAGLKPENVDETVLVGGSTRVPLVRRRVAELFGKPPHDEVNPDEAVALGAAVQAGILAGQLKETLLLDIAPLSLGIETLGGAVGRLIPRNSAIPARATERFTTFVDGQTSVDIHVLQGERELAKDCRSLGRFRLTG